MSRTWKHRSLLVIPAILVAVVGGLIAGSQKKPGTPSVALEAASSQQPNPFTQPIGADADNVQSIASNAGTVSGSSAGLYAAKPDGPACDREALISKLAASPSAASAWAGVRGITTDAIPDYVRGLTPAFLRADTYVTNFSYEDGRATPVPAVLQAGTAVLVDSAGEPVTKCSCGNPLGPPQYRTWQSFYGAAWHGFQPTTVWVIRPARAAITQFIMVNVVYSNVVVNNVVQNNIQNNVNNYVVVNVTASNYVINNISVGVVVLPISTNQVPPLVSAGPSSASIPGQQQSSQQQSSVGAPSISQPSNSGAPSVVGPSSLPQISKAPPSNSQQAPIKPPSNSQQVPYPPPSSSQQAPIEPPPSSEVKPIAPSWSPPSAPARTTTTPPTTSPSPQSPPPQQTTIQQTTTHQPPVRQTSSPTAPRSSQ